MSDVEYAGRSMPAMCYPGLTTQTNATLPCVKHHLQLVYEGRSSPSSRGAIDFQTLINLKQFNSMPNMKPKSAHRYRICGTPVRTGCITCKIRRVKCDEAKPFCKRCTSTGRKCDGYAPPSETKPGQKRSPSKSLFVNTAEDPMEQSTLYFFSTYTAPKLAGYFSASFWEKRVPQASTAEPSIRHAMIAIGAVHQDFCNRHENTAAGFDVSLKAFAIRHYTKAISHLHQLMATRTQQLDITLISCILFIVFDCLIGHHTSALIHLKAGLKILEDIKAQNAAGGATFNNTSTHEWEREFAPLLLGLGVQAASFVNPRFRKDRAGLWESLKAVRIPTHPLTFHSLDEARHALETLAVDIMGERTSESPHPEQQDKETHIAALKNWTKALDRYLTNYATRETSVSRVRCGANMLKVHSLMMTIVVDPSASEDKFERIISLCEFLVAANTSCGRTAPLLSFSADFGIIAPLFFTALRAPSVSLQQRAYDLLSRAPGREGMWDSDDALLVAGEAILGSEHSNIKQEYPVWNDIQERLHAEPFSNRRQDISILSSTFVHEMPVPMRAQTMDSYFQQPPRSTPLDHHFSTPPPSTSSHLQHLEYTPHSTPPPSHLQSFDCHTPMVKLEYSTPPPSSSTFSHLDFTPQTPPSQNFGAHTPPVSIYDPSHHHETRFSSPPMFDPQTPPNCELPSSEGRGPFIMSDFMMEPFSIQM